MSAVCKRCVPWIFVCLLVFTAGTVVATLSNSFGSISGPDYLANVQLNHQKSLNISYTDFLSFSLTLIIIFLTGLGLGIGVLAFITYNNFREFAKEKIQEQVEKIEGPLNERIEKRVDTRMDEAFRGIISKVQSTEDLDFGLDNETER